MTTKPCGNEHCDKCNPLPRWNVSKHRIQHITHRREIKAATKEEALAIFEAPTAWPSSYDDMYGEIMQEDDAIIEPVTDEHRLDFYRNRLCYHDLTSKLKEAGIEGFEDLNATNDGE